MGERAKLALGVWAAVATACSGDPTAFAELADVCGEPGPVQILALEREEVVNEHWPTAPRVDDRVYYGVRRFDHPITNVEVTRLPAEQREYSELDARIVSIDRCGEDLRVLAEGVDFPVPPTAPDEPWLGYRSETGGLFWLDPDGLRAPQYLTQTLAADALIVRGNRVWVQRKKQRDIVRVTLDDTVTVETVFEGVDQSSPRFDPRVNGKPTPRTMLVLYEDGRLVASDLDSGRSTAVLSGVGSFLSDDTQRWILWSAAVLDADAAQPEQWFLYDRDTSRSRLLDDGEDYTANLLFIRDVVLLQKSTGLESTVDFDRTQVILLPGLQTLTLSARWEYAGSNGHGTFAIKAPRPHRDRLTWETRVFTLRGGELVRLDVDVDDGFVAGDSIWSSECSDAGVCEISETPLETLRPQLVERAQRGTIALPGDRWLMVEFPEYDPKAWRPDPRVELRVLDGDTGDHALLARDVSPGFLALEPHESQPMLPWHTDEIVYQVRDLVGDRTGLWRARFE